MLRVAHFAADCYTGVPPWTGRVLCQIYPVVESIQFLSSASLLHR